ncbi:hypothetical protein ACDF64_04540 [Agromyces sp. MMS24-JH15]|uniref:hypothetical protein n=1 Tax=Agromyces sp. MMS24-JH15 TaxID=3243765 RepID=UPI003748A8A8
MSDDLVITSGGGTRVASDDLLVEAVRLGAIAGSAADWAARAGVIGRGLALVGLEAEPGAWNGLEPDRALTRAGYFLDHAADRADRLRRDLVEAAERYGETEARIARLWDLGARLGATIFMPTVLGIAAPVVAAMTGVAVLGPVVGVDTADLARRVLADPTTLRFVRAAGGAVDELVLTSLGVPAPLALLIGNRMRAPENASVILLGAAAAGLVGSTTLVEGPVAVRRADTAPAHRRTPPPAGVGEVSRRIPVAEEGTPQIVVERYGEGDDARFIAYIGGTVTFEREPTTQPMDLTNAVAGVEEASTLPVDALLPESTAAGERAALAALEAAGATADSPVIVVGHSAGGTIAAALAAGDEVNVVAGYSFGGPVGPFDTGDTPFLSVEHADDLVPTLGGAAQEEPAGRVRVTRSAVGDPADAPIPAHALRAYRETGALIDASDAPEVEQFTRILTEFTGEDPGVRTEWRVERVGASG